MDLNWLQSILFGTISGLMDILPGSAQAHRVLLLKFFGVRGVTSVTMLMVHLGIFAALYHTSRAHMVRMSRAKRLSRVPPKKRKRPLDVRSLMDRSLLMTMLVPVMLGVFLYQYTTKLQSNLGFVALFLLLNGIVLYIPQFLPTGNRDSRNMSRVEGLLMGLGGVSWVLPGVSAMGTAVSVGSVCGVEHSYGLTMALLMNLFLNLGLMVYDVMGIAQQGLGTMSFLILLHYLVIGICAFGGTMLGIRGMRRLASGGGYSMAGLYCIGLAIFTFILNLMA